MDIYVDGGCVPNPGKMRIGVVLKGAQDELISEEVGIGTNNQAEYMALIRGMVEAKKRGEEILTVYMDSKLVVNQVKGWWKMKNAGLEPLLKRVQELRKDFKIFQIYQIPREKNTEADALTR